MPRLTWGDPGQRFYETGIDQVVLYVPGSDGIAWTGVISVDESPTGGDPRPYYLDGVKYLNLSSAEEYGATLNAFQAPLEFGPCDGSVQLQNGLFATQQPRQSFDLSYRTQMGNDTQRESFGYKIHLIYNALAGPSSRSNQTNSDSPQPTTLSWPISTMPPEMTGVKPTAHLVIKSWLTDPDVLAEVEDLLYGSSSGAAVMPTPDELVAIFTP